MKLYATMRSERASRDVKKSADEYIEIELSAFGKRKITLVFEVNTDANDKPVQYLLKYALDAEAKRYRGGEWAIIEEGHKTEGIIQKMDRLV